MSDHSEIRWLSDHEQRVWRSYLMANSELQARLDRQLRADAGMPVAYYQILVMLSESPDRAMRMSCLAELLHSSRSRLSHAVSALEKYGWISRCAHAHDRRGSVARLTDTGYEALVRAAPGHVTEVREVLFDALTPEQLDSLHEISQAVLAKLRERCGTPGTPPP
ncbi:MarR family winged helix-turn-helix transcriptional regulator [Streptomyces sp. 6N223]|uniref:MarR family winged helix-turn-helix transcriptional regulator n=1 Tax=Streptomyces sp. 6N223 TaxID=3457412 RepID=UPI003FD4BC9D